MSDGLEIKPYASGDENAIVDLFAASFGQSLDIDSWRWRYLENPYGGPLIDLMWDGDTLAGQYAVSPIDMSIGGQTVPCALSLDTMTHPEYGRRGIFTRLATNLYQRIAEAGRAMVWGFPNKNSHYGLTNRLGWSDIATIPALYVHSSPEVSMDTEIQTLDSFDDQVDMLFQGERTRHNCLAVRSAQYLNWRFFSRPGRQYFAAGAFSAGRLLGYTVYKLYQDTEQVLGDIVEVFSVMDEHTFSDLVAWTVQDLFSRGAQAADIWMNDHSPFYANLVSMGFKRGSAHTFFGGRVFSKMLPRGQTDWSNWYIQMGDSDVY